MRPNDTPKVYARIDFMLSVFKGKQKMDFNAPPIKITKDMIHNPAYDIFKGRNTKPAASKPYSVKRRAKNKALKRTNAK